MTDCIFSLEQSLRDALGEHLKTQVILAPYTTLQIGSSNRTGDTCSE
jgi:hypothetical protein